jgi:hypothetical protein
MIQISSDGQQIHGTSGKTWSALQTKIVQVEEINKLTIIREDYYDFKGSNVYALDENFKQVWTAELHHSSDVFVGFRIDNGNLMCQTWNGFACEIDVKNGRFMGKKFTK